MKIIFIIILILLLACDEQDADMNDDDNKFGWKIIDIFKQDSSNFSFTEILNVTDSSVYLFTINNSKIFDKSEIYIKNDNTDSEFISTMPTSIFYSFDNYLICVGNQTFISKDNGKNWTTHSFNNIKDVQKLNNEIIFLIDSLGLVKLNYDLKSFSLIDSSFLDSKVINNVETKTCKYNMFRLFENNNCIMFDFNNNEIVKYSNNFQDNIILKQKDIFSHLSNFKGFGKITKGMISFASENTIYIIKKDGIYKTSNTGKDWSKVLDIPFNSYSRLYSFDENTIYYLNADNRSSSLYVSTNGGINFIEQILPNNSLLVDFKFLNKNTAYGVGITNEILKTTNGGF